MKTAHTQQLVMAPGPTVTAAGRALVAAVGALVVLDVVGGLLAVRSDVNTWSQAWGGEARLAAPLPMIAVQLLLTWLAVHRNGRPAVAGAGLLAAACLVSVASGFFDGGLSDQRLTAALSAYQVLLLTATAVVGVLALVMAVDRLRERNRSRSRSH